MFKDMPEDDLHMAPVRPLPSRSKVGGGEADGELGERETERQRQRQRDRETEAETERQRQTERKHREHVILCLLAPMAFAKLVGSSVLLWSAAHLLRVCSNCEHTCTDQAPR